MNPEIELEVPDPVATDQRKRIFNAFDRLGAGQTLQLFLTVLGGAPALLADFQDRYRRGFDWWPLDKRANSFSVLISKRAAEGRTISSFLGSDHHRLTGYWEEFLEAVKTCGMSYETLFTKEKGYRVAAVDRLSQFVFGMRRHIQMEEDQLFPLFEERIRTFAGSGPTTMMRAEHQEIGAILAAVEKLRGAGDCATVIQTIEGQPVHPSALLRSHQAKEESVLYLMADRLFTQREKDELCLKMQAL